MTDQPERLSTDELPPDCPAWAGALFGELALGSDLTSFRVVEVLGLLDLMLPGTDGIEQMRGILNVVDVPVIFLSAYGQ